MNKEKLQPYAKYGARLQNIIKAKGMSIYKFSFKCGYSTSRAYRLCNGECDFMTMEVGNAIIISKVLGYHSVEEFLKDLGLDI